MLSDKDIRYCYETRVYIYISNNFPKMYCLSPLVLIPCRFTILHDIIYTTFNFSNFPIVPPFSLDIRSISNSVERDKDRSCE